MTRIIFFGRTGVGKSTVASMLYQNRLYAHGNIFEISDSSIGETLDCCHVSNNSWSIYDTIGLGETPAGSVPHEVAKDRITQFLKNLRVPFNYVCIVKKRGRLDQLDTVILQATKEIFKGATKDNIILLITDAEETWIHSQRDNLQEVYGNIPICAVNFPPVNTDNTLENIYATRRQESLQRLKNFLDKLNYPARKADICFYTETQLKQLATKVFSWFAGAVGVALVLCSIQ